VGFADIFGRSVIEVSLLGGVVVVMGAALVGVAIRRRNRSQRSAEPEPLLVFPDSKVRRPNTPAPIEPGLWKRQPLDGGNGSRGVDEASETIRLPTAADGTIQLLPGRLVMLEGPEVGREFRFLRVGNQPVPEVTIGRASGPPYRHIQLTAATVSRMHARIRYQDGRWLLANLSTTNPLRLNGRELPPMQDAPLANGDRIQLGEVELSYLQGS